MDIGPFSSFFEDVGLDSEHVNEMLREFQNHHYGHSKNLSEYYVGAAGLFVAESRYGDEVYSDVFHGDYDLLPSWVEEYNEFVDNNDY